MTEAPEPHTSGASIARDIVQAVAVPSALLDADRILCANDALCRLSSRGPTELAGLSLLDLVDVDSRPPLRSALQNCAEHGEQPPVVSASIVTLDGGLRPVEIHARRVCFDDQAQVMVTCVDLSDVMHVQSSLLKMTKMLSQIIDGASVPSLVIDKQHRVTHWNTACERMTGIPRGEVLGSRDGWKAFYPKKRPLLAEMIVDGVDEATLRSFYGGQMTLSSTTPGGVEVESFFPQFGPSGKWLFFTAAPLYDAQGQVIGAIETLQDVTARRTSEDALLRHRNELEELVRQRSAELATTARNLEMFIVNSPIGVAYTSGGIIQRVNPAMADMLGYIGGDMIGLPGRAVYLSDADYAAFGRYAGPLLSQGEPIHSEMWLRHADGHPIWAQIDAHVADTCDTAQGTWWMMQDRSDIRDAQAQLQARVTDLHAMNRQLEEAQNQLLQQDKMASIGQLAAGVAHEINNPIGFVSSNLNTLRLYVSGLLGLSEACDAALAAPGDAATLGALAKKREDIEIEFLREDLPMLLDECADGLGRVKKIVQDLKDFSRVDHSDWAEADLNAGLESTLNVVRHEVKYKADVVKQLAPLPPVTCLLAQLNQVFMNLIVNAAHAIAEKGTITLLSGVEQGWAWVQVEDTGCGMSAEVQRRIFEPFFTTKDVGKGTGLGMSLSFSIVQKHGGTIQVHSAVGRGSAIRVWLPVDGPQSLAKDAKPPLWTHAHEHAT
ncbi:MAG: PAS domain S-box protein [Hydrogenophaga sp.]|uniref:PAS domain-containing protein n=1 Tax=Hydrogenophaga sp. TaxID=1904254 RepID=UPI0025C2FF85|nr:PAS domain-containing protein [Hydrogenophaga sp.]MBT9553158.1 PAS domain S-box protein [Hydrogenophaga sp.]